MLSWLFWGTVVDLCRSHVLLDADGVACARRRLKVLGVSP
jgi:hypothetical protein